ncbi:hypothetical protein C8R47DRAFT_1212057 [Mycena vitilis]|nr:hypothetical protein C8R47DRAFT_1212057 [Mycena vitilis]
MFPSSRHLPARRDHRVFAHPRYRDKPRFYRYRRVHEYVQPPRKYIPAVSCAWENGWDGVWGSWGVTHSGPQVSWQDAGWGEPWEMEGVHPVTGETPEEWVQAGWRVNGGDPVYAVNPANTAPWGTDGLADAPDVEPLVLPDPHPHDMGWGGGEPWGPGGWENGGWGTAPDPNADSA